MVRSPNVVRMIQRFNEVSSWVKTTILTEINLKRRIKILSKFIDILGYLDQLDNVNGVLEFVSALDTMAILRLQQTVGGLSTCDWLLFSRTWH